MLMSTCIAGSIEQPALARKAPPASKKMTLLSSNVIVAETPAAQNVIIVTEAACVKAYM